jgi:hypothetical protein
VDWFEYFDEDECRAIVRAVARGSADGRASHEDARRALLWACRTRASGYGEEWLDGVLDGTLGITVTAQDEIVFTWGDDAGALVGAAALVSRH